MDCLTCPPVEGMVNLLSTTRQQVYTFLADSFIELLLAMVLFFAVWDIAKAMVFGRGFEWGPTFEKIFIANLVVGALGSGVFWWPLFDLIVDGAAWMAKEVATLGSVQLPTRDGLPGFIEMAENIFLKKFGVTLTTASKEISIANLAITFGLLLCVVMFALLGYKMIEGVVGSYFIIQAVALLSPVLVFFFAFEKTREITINALKMLLVGGLRMYQAMAMAALVMIAFNHLIPEDITRVNSAPFWQLVFVLVLMWLGHNKFIEVTGQLFQVFGQQWQSGAGGMIRGAINKIRGN